MGDAADDTERRAEAEREEGGVATIEVTDAVIERSRAGEMIVREPTGLSPQHTVDQLLARRDIIRDAMARAMERDVHYGTIPGTQKPALYKPGAEMLNVLFELAVSFPEDRQVEEIDPASDHRTYKSLCVITDRRSGLHVAEAHGACSTREKKYAYRGGSLVCPECATENVKKGKTRDKSADQYYCWRKQGGCGATWEAGTEQFAVFEEERKAGVARQANPDIPDSWNTVLKMSEKRALIAATLIATAASEFFTQDVEDQPGRAGDSSTRQPVRQDPPPTPIPGSWAALKEAWVEKSLVDWEWALEAIEVKFQSKIEDLDPQVRKTTAFQFAQHAYVTMMDKLGSKLEFPGPLRDDLRTLFAPLLDGVRLEGPPWRMHPPDYDPGEQDYEVKTTEADPDEASADDIPF